MSGVEEERLLTRYLGRGESRGREEGEDDCCAWDIHIERHNFGGKELMSGCFLLLLEKSDRWMVGRVFC